MAHAKPPETKARAKAIYEQEGAMAAAEQLGISVSTVRGWAREGHWKRDLPSAGEIQAAYADQQQAKAILIGWQVRKRSLADEAGQAAQEVLTMLRVRVAKGVVYGIEPLARAFAMLTERADAMAAGTGGAEQGAAMTSAERMEALRARVAAIKARTAGGGA